MNSTILDAKHLLCPLPVIRLQQAINRLNNGDTIELHCTDPGVLQDVPAWCRVHGHTCLDIKKTPEAIILTVKKNET